MLRDLQNEDDDRMLKDPAGLRKRAAEADTAEAKAKGAHLDLLAKQENVLETLYDELSACSDGTDARTASKRARIQARILALERDLNKASGIGVGEI